MSHPRDHGYNFTYRDFTAILDDDNTDDAIYAPYDHEDDYENPYIRHDDIIELDIAGVDDNINDSGSDNNTDGANTYIHNDSEINTTDNTYVLQPPSEDNTEDKGTKNANIEYEDTK